MNNNTHHHRSNWMSLLVLMGSDLPRAGKAGIFHYLPYFRKEEREVFVNQLFLPPVLGVHPVNFDRYSVLFS